MGTYFTQRVSVQKMVNNPRSSRLCVRKECQSPSKGTEAGSVRREKVHPGQLFGASHRVTVVYMPGRRQAVCAYGGEAGGHIAQGTTGGI